MELGLASRACAVTGASRGIGRATAERLAAEGADVLLISRGAHDLEQAVQGCREQGERAAGGGELPRRPRVASLQLDVTAPGAGNRVVAEAEAAFGQLDVLVNNAGWTLWRPVDEIPEEDWRAQFEINVMAPLQAMQAALPAMAERGWGRVVNVCSSTGKRPSAMYADYSVAKAAELSLSRFFADRYASDGVLVNAICPGPVRSELWTAEGGLAEQARESLGAGSSEDAIAMVGAGRPAGRVAEVDEIADVIAFLCSERASYVSGAAWSVDGGTVPVII